MESLKYFGSFDKAFHIRPTSLNKNERLVALSDNTCPSLQKLHTEALLNKLKKDCNKLLIGF